jgi:hypothetical protein
MNGGNTANQAEYWSEIFLELACLKDKGRFWTVTRTSMIQKCVEETEGV